MIGGKGHSGYFMVGKLEVVDSAFLAADLKQLWHDLLADPYFRKVPSMQEATGKTAIFFHAKDDLPEIRREVFRLLMRHDLRFHAVLRDKRAALAALPCLDLAESFCGT